MLWLLSLILLAPKGVVESKPGRVQVDWTAGRITAVGVGAPDLRAPGPAVARVAAERNARRAAERRLFEVAEALPWASGRKSGKAGALDAAKRLVHDLEVRYSSDGSVEVTLALPLEAVRQAVVEVAPPAADDSAPTAVVVDLGRFDLAPALGVTLQAGATKLSGPTVWHKEPKAAEEDPRLGPRPLQVKAGAAKDGVVTLEVDEAKLAAAAKAGALVVMVARRWDGKR